MKSDDLVLVVLRHYDLRHHSEYVTYAGVTSGSLLHGNTAKD